MQGYTRSSFFVDFKPQTPVIRFDSGHSFRWRFGSREPGFESCIQQRKTTCLLSISYHFPVASASKLTPKTSKQCMDQIYYTLCWSEMGKYKQNSATNAWEAYRFIAYTRRMCFVAKPVQNNKLTDSIELTTGRINRIQPRQQLSVTARPLGSALVWVTTEGKCLFILCHFSYISYSIFIALRVYISEVFCL